MDFNFINEMSSDTDDNFSVNAEWEEIADLKIKK